MTQSTLNGGNTTRGKLRGVKILAVTPTAVHTAHWWVWWDRKCGKWPGKNAGVLLVCLSPFQWNVRSTHLYMHFHIHVFYVCVHMSHEHVLVPLPCSAWHIGVQCLFGVYECVTNLFGPYLAHLPKWGVSSSKAPCSFYLRFFSPVQLENLLQGIT